MLILQAHEIGDSVEGSALPPTCAGSLAFFYLVLGLEPHTPDLRDPDSQLAALIAGFSVWAKPLFNAVARFAVALA